ncbi:imm11 family protein [Emticicia sp. TH156]|uniref:imm11 family protein n=1 Tax=Emticicia sp. TH156 TaxID=2067454 RepID=UPI000C78C5BB|nr:hypothetical protein [Emticicia sp. TH156]PLK45789.1 hypothetical protein C0V77_00060 [Emticicia sp. TH156]
MEVEYYIFTTDGGEPKVTGIRTGTGQAWFDDTFWAKNKQIKDFMWPNDRKDNRFRTGIQPDFSLDLRGLPMHKNAKHTDLIYLSSLLHGFIVSSKFRELLEQFKLPPHNFYQVSFNQPDKKSKEINEVSEYWYFYFQKETGEQTIDFANSEFDRSFHTKYLNLKEDELRVSTYEEYMNIFYNTGTALAATKLFLNESFNKELDLWRFSLLSSKCYSSEKLIKSIEEKKITGVRAITRERAKKTAQMIGESSCELFFVNSLKK